MTRNATTAELIVYEPRYFIDEPTKHGRADYEVILLIRRYVGRRVKSDAKSWSGDTLEEAERKMVDWIEKSGATEHVRRCRKCGCTDGDCRGCIERTGEACHWVEEDLCSACVPESMRSLTPAKSARKKLPRRK